VPNLGMQIPESHHELLAGLHTAVVSTVTPSGAVQTTAVWFLHDAAADVIRISITDSRKKFRNLTENPNMTFFLLDPADQWKYIEIRGTVTIEPDPTKALMLQIGEKHRTDVSGFDAPGTNRVHVTLTPTRVNCR
jgi:PPOX class probable F420-dependent enzyme